MNVKFLLFVVCAGFIQIVSAQTSWKGTTSTNWSTSSNWTAGVPSSTVDAVIGDANFTGPYQPLLTSTSNCKALTIGTGSVPATLTIGRSLNVAGNVLIGANGTVLANSSSKTITVKGNWTNNGTYTATKISAKVTFSGTAQTLTGVTAFQSLTVNTSSTLTLANNISVAYLLTVSGVLDPTASYVVSGTGSLTVNSAGTIMVNTANFSGNYTLSGTVSLNRTSTVNYASASIAQNISSSYTYGWLRISGGSTKSLTANLPGLSASSITSGSIFIDAGTLDLKTFTANRSLSGGGSITIASGATLRIGGTNTFPSNYSTYTIAATSNVEYYGNNQTVLAASYGNLALSATSGSVTKTMPGTAFTVAGNFTSSAGTGTAVAFTAAQAITVNGNVTIGASCTFNGGSYAHNFKSAWINNGTYTGNTSSVTFSGVAANLSGTGTNNFYDLNFTAYGITGNGTTSINVSGNLNTTAPGLFTHASGGTVTMTGTSKTLGGNGFEFSNLVISGSVTYSGNNTITGNLTNNGTFTASSGTITISGSSSTIAGSAAPTFYSLSITGNTSTAVSFNMLSNLSIASSASMTASAGTATFNGTSTLSGTANLYNVIINASKTLTLGNSSILGIAGALTRTGTLDVTTVTPNTVNFNSTGAQSILAATYHNLTLSGGGTKTPSGALTVNSDFTIGSGVTFNASSFVFSLYRHWNNYGTFTASTSDIQLKGINAATITGATTFNTFTVNKSSSAIKITLATNIAAASVVMTTGNMETGSNSVTITSSRTGNGLIIGTIVHNHAFANGTAYAFEGPNNLITFTSPSSVNSVTVTVKKGEITDFDPAIECVTREYEIYIPSGTYTSAKFRMHYENNELNAFSEPYLALYKHNSGIVWDSLGYTGRDTAANYVELSGITFLPGRYTGSGIRNIVRWNGSVSTAWHNASNWTTVSGTSMSNRVPTSTDAAIIGDISYTNHPAVTTSQTVSVLRFGSAKAATLTINGGALTTLGSFRGQWSASRSHIVDVSSGTLNVGTNLLLSDGTSNHDINLKIGSGTVNVTYDLNQSATGAVTFTGSGSLVISGDYNYTAGTFTAGTGTVTYSGGEAQDVARVTYNNLSFTKTTERASFQHPTTVTGNLSISTGGEVDVFDTLTVGGNISIGSATYLYNQSARINLGGNWVNNGTYVPANGSVNFNGNGSQTANATTFSNMLVSKTGGTMSLTGNMTITNSLSLNSGTFDLDTFQANRFTEGGTFTIGAGATLKIRGANNFPLNYITYTLAPTSTVNYYGTVAQSVMNIIYGNLTITNGTSNAKSLSGNTQINGDLLINSGSTLSPGIHSIIMYGNITNSGTYSTGTGAVTLNGTSKTITGSTTFNDLSVILGSYTVSSGTTTITGDLYIESTGSLSFGNNTASLDGDLTNKGSLTSNGTSTFTGTRVQTIQLLNAITSSSTGVINFNGSVAPVINSTSSPSFATVNINNTSGVTPSVPWSVFVAFNVASGATFNAGPLTHTFYGNFTNNGTVNSSGKLKFTPGTPFSASATIKLDGVSFVSSGEVEFAGTAPITIQQVNPSLNIVNITNTHSSGVAAPGAWTIAEELRIGSGAIFYAGSYSHLVSGSVLNNGTLEGQTSTMRFDGTGAELNGLGTYDFNNIKIEAAGDLTLNRGITVFQNFILDGAFDGSDRSVKFTGSSGSTISGAAGLVTFGDMEQEKSGVAPTLLSVPILITGDLQLTSGKIMTTATNILSIAEDGTASSGNATSFVSGPMKKIGDDAFVFPVGKGNAWARIGISAPSSVTDEFTAQYFNAAYSNTTSMATTPSPVLNHVSVIEYWTCDRTVGTSNVTVTLYWENSTSGATKFTSDLVVARWNGTAWENKGQSAITGSTPGNVTSNTVTSFSPFTFGSLTSGPLNPLPVTMLSFEGSLNADKKVDLQWKTATEINTDYFTVEKSRDGVNFSQLTIVDAAGNSNDVRKYAMIDPLPYANVTYYRLKITDLDGQSTYSNVVAIVNNEISVLGITAYPNPSNGILNLNMNTGGEQGSIIIRNTMGDEVMRKSMDAGAMQLDLSALGKGIYTITLETASGTYTCRINKI